MAETELNDTYVFIIDKTGTLNAGPTNEWHDLTDLMKANGHKIVVVTGDSFSDDDAKALGYEGRKYFDDWHPYKMKSNVFINEVVKKFGVTKACMIDDEQHNLNQCKVANSENETILFSSVAETKRILIEKNILK